MLLTYYSATASVSVAVSVTTSSALAATVGTGKSLCSFFNVSKDELLKEDDSIKIAIVGKPNAGKSSILNNLLKKQRAIVSNVSGTTRDSIDEEIIFEDKVYRLVERWLQ